MHAGVASSRLFEKLKMHPSHAERQTNGGARRRLKGSAETNKSWYTKKVAESGAKWKKMSLLALFYANYLCWRAAETTVATLTTSGGDESDM
jgi:hypothetical protein